VNVDLALQQRLADQSEVEVLQVARPPWTSLEDRLEVPEA